MTRLLFFQPTACYRSHGPVMSQWHNGLRDLGWASSAHSRVFSACGIQIITISDHSTTGDELWRYKPSHGHLSQRHMARRFNITRNHILRGKARRRRRQQPQHPVAPHRAARSGGTSGRRAYQRRLTRAPGSARYSIIQRTTWQDSPTSPTLALRKAPSASTPLRRATHRRNQHRLSLR